MPADVGGQTTLRSLVWVDRNGHEERIKAPLRAYGPPRISPDGTRLAIGILDQGNTEIWIWDLGERNAEALDLRPGMNGLPVWTPDGRRIIFMSDRTGMLNLYSQAVDGTGTADRLTTSTNPQWPTSDRARRRPRVWLRHPAKASGRRHPGSADSSHALTSAATRAAPVAQNLFAGSLRRDLTERPLPRVPVG